MLALAVLRHLEGFNHGTLVSLLPPPFWVYIHPGVFHQGESDFCHNLLMEALSIPGYIHSSPISFLAFKSFLLGLGF